VWIENTPDATNNLGFFPRWGIPNERDFNCDGHVEGDQSSTKIAKRQIRRRTGASQLSLARPMVPTLSVTSRRVRSSELSEFVDSVVTIDEVRGQSIAPGEDRSGRPCV